LIGICQEKENAINISMFNEAEFWVSNKTLVPVMSFILNRHRIKIIFLFEIDEWVC